MDDGNLSEIGRNKYAETSDGSEQKTATKIRRHREERGDAAVKTDYINLR
jgi:hypothetical protein